MVVTFTTRLPVGETMAFDAVYEPVLQLTLAEKSAVIADGYAAWMFVDGVLAGETYAVSPVREDDDFEDLPHPDASMLYCYSTTILPAFQGRGLAKLLVAYSLGQANASGFSTVVGHATSPAMVAVRAYFGARFGPVHPRWYGTSRTAHFYSQALN